ncbi:MAG: hypothetical protein CMI02_06700 [Oceanospirillaceae bacterium]|nr:hypothetical protein [Oceanospirillaceae bacterium]MBT11705.1 hypothetical protein [Oceanospirillaceae bacterium]|tara:strand:- start:68654 stop:69493 length:840 start_codon:yes stop_codon:yes gene_type:complete
MNIKRHQSGMTLIELMVAAALGVIISYFIMNIMVTSARSAGVAEGLAQAQETGRLVMAWMSEEVAIGGYNNDYLSGANDVPAVAELCDASNAAPPAAGGHCTFNANNNVTGGDRLAIQRTLGGLDPGPRDSRTCTGEAVGAALIDDQIEVTDVYWVRPNTADADVTNDNQLWCVTYDNNGNVLGTAQSIANGVEGMQILLGIGSDSGDVEHYETPSAATDFSQVVALRIAILTRDFSGTTLDPDKRTYGLLDSDPVTYEDQVARYVQTGTIWFPNKKAI